MSLTLEEVEKVNILIADDHSLFRSGLKKLLSGSANIDKIFEAANGQEAIIQCEKGHVQLVLMDLQMNLVNGIEASATIRKRWPHIKVIALTLFEKVPEIMQLYHDGVNGCLLKDASLEELRLAIDKVTNNIDYYTPRVLDILLGNLQKNGYGNRQESEERLSKREKEILKLLCKQWTNEEIGAKMFLSHLTIKSHRRHIMEKTGCKTLAAIIVYALQHEMVSVEDL